MSSTACGGEITALGNDIAELGVAVRPNNALGASWTISVTLNAV
jgi:hypothetical protein